MKKAIYLGLFLTLSVIFTPVSVNKVEAQQQTQSTQAFTHNAKYGDSGSYVKEMQEFLVDRGVCSISPTGNFFSLTLSCVKAFQTKEGISPVSGYWGPLTRAKASAKLDLSASDSEEQVETGTVVAPMTDSNFDKLLALMAQYKAGQDAQTAIFQAQVQQPIAGVPAQPIVTTPAPQASLKIFENVQDKNGISKIDGFNLDSITAKKDINSVNISVKSFDASGNQVDSPITVTTNDPDFPSTFNIQANTGFLVGQHIDNKNIQGIALNCLGNQFCYPVSVGTFNFTFSNPELNVSKSITITITD